MCGLPIGIKDLFCTKVPSQAASNILKVRSNTNPLSARICRTQARDAGKLNMDEFAMGSSNETACYGNVVNPWRRTR